MARIVNSKGLSTIFGVDDSLDDFFNSLDSDVEKPTPIIKKEDEPLDKILDLEEQGEQTKDESLIVVDKKSFDSELSKIKSDSTELSTYSNDELELKQEVNVDETFVTTSAKDMISELKDFIAAAKYLITTSPDPKSLESAANLFNSASTLLKDISSITTLKRKEKANIAMEKLKQKHRLELQSAKISIQNMDVTNNTVNINTVSYSQEDVIRKLKNNKGS